MAEAPPPPSGGAVGAICYSGVLRAFFLMYSALLNMDSILSVYTYFRLSFFSTVIKNKVKVIRIVLTFDQMDPNLQSFFVMVVSLLIVLLIVGGLGLLGDIHDLLSVTR